MRRLSLARVALLLLALGVFAALAVWVGRKPLADNAIERELVRRGVPARYNVKSIGLRWQRLEDISIGDPARPDLTADWAEIRIVPGWSGVRLTTVRASGVRLRGRLTGGRLSLGAVDKLLPPPSGKPFTIPDINVDLADARLALATPLGDIAARLDGKGGLTNGFRGELVTTALTLGDRNCSAANVVANIDLTIRRRQPSIAGPLRAVSMRCAGVDVAGPAVALKTTLSEALDRWQGTAVMTARRGASGRDTLDRLQGTVDFNGSAAGTTGRTKLTAASGTVANNGLSNASLGGTFRVAPGSAVGEGRLTIGRFEPEDVYARRVADAARNATGSPIGPLLVRLAEAVRLAGRGLAIESSYAVSSGKAGVSLGIADLIARGAGGSLLRVEGGEGMRFGAAGFEADTALRLSGGGLPTVEATLRRQANGDTSGIARIAPYANGNARLTAGPIGFAVSPAGAMRLTGTATLDGPLGDGSVTGLRMPVNALVGSRGTVVVNPGCTPLAFQTLSISGLVLAPASLRLCNRDGLVRIDNGRLSGGAAITAPRLSGRIGTTPVTLAANGANVRLGTRGFTVGAMAARFGSAQRISRLDIGSLSGRLDGSDIAGGFENTLGQIGNVPLLVDRSGGSWRLSRGVLTIAGAATVSDTADPSRFFPMDSTDMRLRLANGQVTVTGSLYEPKSKVTATNVDIAHDLRTGTGRALLNVAGIEFGKSIQPEALTRLSLGVVANVEGRIKGAGRIDWSPERVTSTGRFTTSGMNFAAAFGPVTGLRGEIVFSDLLALATGPAQTVTIDTINPGIPISRGLITYRLLPGQKLQIEGGRWPFAGGDLLLDPSLVDLGESVERRLTFRIVGLDAAKFVEQIEFENFAATGTFDGVMPMIFDQSGGRIANGRMVVRPGGGTLAYVGEVSNAAMNIYAKLAFDALKSIRYQNLTIEMDGAIDGEIVSKVSFNGRNQRPVQPGDGFVLRQLIGLPFVFNINIKAPFRGLLATARTYQDPSLLLRQVVPDTVQPPESEKRP